MYFVLLLLAFLAIFFLPQIWANRTLKRYQVVRDSFPGTGGEFAQHLINKLHLDHVELEATEQGDHYSPHEKTVRLNSKNYNAKTLTAIVTAAHEVGHALQDKLDYRPLKLRTSLAQLAYHSERAGALLIYAIPVLAAITRTPHSGFVLLVLGVATMSISSIVHIITLPVEFDASFKRAMPILEAGNYLDVEDIKNARKILLACALTYVAASLSGLFNIWRWITIFKR